MSPNAVPARITIDFRDAVDPSRTWILGLGVAGPERVDMLAFEERPAPTFGANDRPLPRPLPRPRPTALTADCACPDFCERDHANE